MLFRSFCHLSTLKKFISMATLMAISSIFGYNLTRNFDFDYAPIVEYIADTGRSKILLDITNFHFVENPKHFCTKGFQNATKGKRVIIVVNSARTNFIKRAIIRRTYGAVTIFRGWSIRTVFSLGLPSTSEDENVANVLKNEVFENDDIVIGNFIDTYHNLSYKQLSGYKWVIEFCPEANYYLKADDDVVVNIFHAIDFLSSNRSVEMDANYYCTRNAVEPVREIGAQYAVTHEEYPGDKYPEFCGVGIYMTGVRNIQKILAVSNIQDFLYLEDVFVTGILRERANREFKNEKEIKFTHAASYQTFINQKRLTEIVESDCFGMMVLYEILNGTCLVWNLVLQARKFDSLFVSTCLSIS